MQIGPHKLLLLDRTDSDQFGRKKKYYSVELNNVFIFGNYNHGRVDNVFQALRIALQREVKSERNNQED